MKPTVNPSKLHELYEQLINTKSTIQPIPRNLRMQKRWSIAVNRTNFPIQRVRNLNREGCYRSILLEVKKLFANTKHPMFERDFKNDNTESALAMHAYLTNSFYFNLECSFMYNYQIQYAFNDCPYEAEIRALIARTSEDSRPTEVKLKPDFATFYLNVLKVQDAKYITY